ncbi:MAG: hypothetical protein GX239_06435 [Clostridiaceae bacterium]|nr:hypothetical protein [Clostridiaceae bacterium]
MTLLLFVGLAYWYIEQRDFFSIRILMITFIIGWLICSVVSLTLIRIHPNVLRGISSGEFSLEGKYAGAGSFGFVYSLPYICIVLALITFHYLKRYRETKIRLWLVIGCVAAVIDILFFVVLVQAKFIMAYLLFFLGLIMLFIFYGQRIKRLLVVLGAGAIAYVPLAHLLLVVADHTANRFIKVRFYEMGNLMLGRLFLASEQSAILGRGGVFKDILDVIRHYPILGAAGREGQFLFHHDFQWLGDYALYGIFIILPLFFIFFQWYRFIKNKTNDTFCRNQLAAFFFMIGLHGLINRLNANELLATLFIFMPFVIIYFSNLDGVNKKLKIDFKEQADDNRGK